MEDAEGGDDEGGQDAGQEDVGGPAPQLGALPGQPNLGVIIHQEGHQKVLYVISHGPLPPTGPHTNYWSFNPLLVFETPPMILLTTPGPLNTSRSS